VINGLLGKGSGRGTGSHQVPGRWSIVDFPRWFWLGFGGREIFLTGGMYIGWVYKFESPNQRLEGVRIPDTPVEVW
jgi:hypothetical protein